MSNQREEGLEDGTVAHLYEWPYLPVCNDKRLVEVAEFFLDMTTVTALHDAHGA